MFKSVNSLLLFIVSMLVSSEILARNNQQLSAYEGNPEAQFQLALAYSQGETDYPLAAYWYTQAARQGMPDAQYNLGHFFLQGIGVKQDIAKTIQWWEQSAHQNYLPAQHNMGTAYFEGIGVKKNPQMAKLWFQRCAKLGSDACVKSLAVVTQNLEHAAPIAPVPASPAPIETIGENITKDKQDTSKNHSTTDSSVQTTNTESSNGGSSNSPEANTSEELSIPVHIQANSNSTIIAQLTDSNDYTVLGNGNTDSLVKKNNDTWQQIQLNKAIAVWSYKQYVAISEHTGKLTADKVRARTEPSTKTGKVITELAKGVELRVLQETDNWVQLALLNHVAWTPVLKQLPIIVNTENNLTDKVTIEETSTNTNKAIAVIKTIETKELAKNTDVAIIAPQKLAFKYTFLDQGSDDDWLFQSDPKQFSLLMGSFDNSKDLTHFATQVGFSKNNNAHTLLAKRHNIEWKYVLYGNFNSKEAATKALKDNNFKGAYIKRIGDIQEQRCSAWKTTIPSPKKLAIHCLKKTANSS